MGGRGMGPQRGPIKPCLIRSPSPWSLLPPPRFPILSPTPGSFLTSRPPPGVQALLRKLQSLVEVPGRLRRWAAPGADPARALHCYARARAVLRHYRHLPSFRAIEDESHAIMAELAQRLRARLRYGHSQPAASRGWGCGGVHSGAYWWQL